MICTLALCFRRSSPRHGQSRNTRFKDWMEMIHLDESCWFHSLMLLAYTFKAFEIGFSFLLLFTATFLSFHSMLLWRQMHCEAKTQTFVMKLFAAMSFNKRYESTSALYGGMWFAYYILMKPFGAMKLKSWRTYIRLRYYQSWNYLCPYLEVCDFHITYWWSHFLQWNYAWTNDI